MAEPRLLIGIDGGGTHSTAAACWENGQVAAAAEGGSLNFHNIGIEAVRRNLEDMVRSLEQQAGCEACAVCAGMSGLDGPAPKETVSFFQTGLLSGKELVLESDAYAALMGLTLGEPGVIVICGTGSMMLMLDSSGRQVISGGWGYRLRDAGSGFTLAREGLLAVIGEDEGWSGATALSGRALSYFGVSRPRDLIGKVYDPQTGPDRIAAFGRFVLEEAAEGDAAALDIVSRNMKELADQTASLLSRDPKVSLTGLYGGVFSHSSLARRLFLEELSLKAPHAEVREVIFPAEIGAVIELLRRRTLGSSEEGPHTALSADILGRLKESYPKVYARL